MEKACRFTNGTEFVWGCTSHRVQLSRCENDAGEVFSFWMMGIPGVRYEVRIMLARGWRIEMPGFQASLERERDISCRHKTLVEPSKVSENHTASSIYMRKDTDDEMIDEVESETVARILPLRDMFALQGAVEGLKMVGCR